MSKHSKPLNFKKQKRNNLNMEEGRKSDMENVSERWNSEEMENYAEESSPSTNTKVSFDCSILNILYKIVRHYLTCSKTSIICP